MAVTGYTTTCPDRRVGSLSAWTLERSLRHPSRLHRGVDPTRLPVRSASGRDRSRPGDDATGYAVDARATSQCHPAPPGWMRRRECSTRPGGNGRATASPTQPKRPGHLSGRPQPPLRRDRSQRRQRGHAPRHRSTTATSTPTSNRTNGRAWRPRCDGGVRLHLRRRCSVVSDLGRGLRMKDSARSTREVERALLQ